MRSLGQAVVRVVLKEVSIAFEFTAHLPSGADTTMLLSLNDINILGFDARTNSGSMWYKNSCQSLCRDHAGLLAIKWDFATECLLSDEEMRKIHSSYGHKVLT